MTMIVVCQAFNSLKYEKQNILELLLQPIPSEVRTLYHELHDNMKHIKPIITMTLMCITRMTV